MNIDHISLVTKFLAGGGPTDYGAGGKPLLFCGAEAGVHQPWDTSIVKDHEGKNVVTDRDPKTKMPTKYLNLGLAFMGVSRNPNANAFWMSKFDGYDLDYDDDTSLCAENPKDGRLRYAKVAKVPSAWPAIYTDDAEFTFSTKCKSWSSSETAGIARLGSGSGNISQKSI